MLRGIQYDLVASDSESRDEGMTYDRRCFLGARNGHVQNKVQHSL